MFESAGSFHSRLDFRVKAYDDSMHNMLIEIPDEAMPATFDPSRHLDHGRQAVVRRLKIQSLREVDTPIQLALFFRKLDLVHLPRLAQPKDIEKSVSSFIKTYPFCWTAVLDFIMP